MAYQVVYEKRDVKSLSKIDKEQQRMIVFWIEKNLKGTTHPKQHGKALKGALKDYWCYRVGDYRILADTDEDEIKIIVVNIVHRKDIYKS